MPKDALDEYYMRGNVTMPVRMGDSIKFIAPGWIGYMMLKNDGTLYSIGLGNRNENWGKSHEEYKLMDTVIDASFGWSQGLCMTSDGMIYQFGQTWSGLSTENAWESDNRKPMSVFLSERTVRPANGAEHNGTVLLCCLYSPDYSKTHPS